MREATEQKQHFSRNFSKNPMSSCILIYPNEYASPQQLHLGGVLLQKHVQGRFATIKTLSVMPLV